MPGHRRTAPTSSRSGSESAARGSAPTPASLAPLRDHPRVVAVPDGLMHAQLDGDDHPESHGLYGAGGIVDSGEVATTATFLAGATDRLFSPSTKPPTG